MGKRTTVRKIETCINRLYTEDKYLFDSEVCERCLMFRLAHYLQAEFPDYFVDCEFNKMGFNEYKHEGKVEPNVRGTGLKRMFVDIIIHKRNSNTEDNFVCLEIKRRKHDIEKDVRRLEIMTSRDGFTYENKKYLFNYDLGFLTYLPKHQNKSGVRIFEKGEESYL